MSTLVADVGVCPQYVTVSGALQFLNSLFRGNGPLTYHQVSGILDRLGIADMEDVMPKLESRFFSLEIGATTVYFNQPFDEEQYMRWVEYRNNLYTIQLEDEIKLYEKLYDLFRTE